MRKIYYLVVCLFFLHKPHIQAQSLKESSFRIKGKIIGGKVSSLQILTEGLFYNKADSLPIRADGQFDMLVKTYGKVEMGVFFDTSVLVINAAPGEVINFCYDLKAGKLVGISGQTPQQTKRLKYDAATLFSAGSRRQLMFMRMRDQNQPDSVKYALCAASYRLELDSLIQQRGILGAALDEYVDELYFSYINMMDFSGLKDYEKLVQLTLGSGYKGVPQADHYKILSKDILLRSNEYRRWIFGETRERVRGDLDYLYVKFLDIQKAASWVEFYKAQGISDPFIKNWYACYSIFFSFQNYNFSETEKVKDTFLIQCQDPSFKRVINDYWASDIKFKTGAPAPTIALTDYKGNRVELNDFKNKVIYIDFWGVHCGACLIQMKEYSPSVETKYGNPDLVFLYVCVEGDKAEQEKIISDLGLKGIHAFCSWQTAIDKYNVNSLPHYMIIDKQGNIRDYHAHNPQEILDQPEFSKLLQ